MTPVPMPLYNKQQPQNPLSHASVETTTAVTPPRITGNVHSTFPRTCGAPLDYTSMIHPGTGLLYQKMEKLNNGGDAHMHIIQKGNNVQEKLEKLTKLQTCMYSSLDRWTKLADEYHVTRWAAVAGSVVGLKCYQSINPWVRKENESF